MPGYGPNSTSNEKVQRGTRGWDNMKRTGVKHICDNDICAESTHVPTTLQQSRVSVHHTDPVPHPIHRSYLKANNLDRY